jgi:triosephosphate isomerase
MALKKLFLLANWKMYLNVAESATLAKQFVKIAKKLPAMSTVVVFPSTLAFPTVYGELKKIKVGVGAQNVYWVEKGGYTGEVSAPMYAEAGATYALVGHAERRQVFHESNHEVRQKLESVLAAGLTPVICVGETAAEKKDEQTNTVLEAQLRAVFTNLIWPAKRELIIAYEPVWAIGTGESCNPTVAEAMAERIMNWTKQLLSGSEPFVVYGGSVNPENIHNYIRLPHFSGVLVGGSSTKIESWQKLMEHLE